MSPIALTPREHTDRAYESELRSLREHVLLMGAKTEEMLAHAIEALFDGDTELARQAKSADPQVNWLEVETDQLGMQILARRQPVASDLRQIIVALKIVTELEHVGDLIGNVCDRVPDFSADAPARETLPVRAIARMAQDMLRAALDAYGANDAELAESVLRKEPEADHLFKHVFDESLTNIGNQPARVREILSLTWVGKYLERIADHATAIAERVVFSVKGEDIRHPGKMVEPAA